MTNLPPVWSTEPLVPVDNAMLTALSRRDTWTLTEALFLLSGHAPPGYESANDLMSHFPDAYSLAVNSILSGNLARKIQVSGNPRFIDAPSRWLSWADEKSIEISPQVRRAVQGEKQPTIKGRGGRPPKWNWEGAVGHLLSIAYGNDGLPAHQSDIERLVADYFIQTVDDEPAESLIREHVSAWCAQVLGKAGN